MGESLLYREGERAYVREAYAQVLKQQKRVETGEPS
jgi:hypothetical protein